MPDPPADLLVEGRIATLAGAAGFAWAEALAVREGSVLAVGRRDELAGLAGPRTWRLRLGADHVVLPGLTDAHLHLVDAALAAGRLVLDPRSSLRAALAAVAAAHRARLAAGDRKGWLLGHGWSPDGLGRWPTADELDGAAPGRPVALWAHDHHARWLSRAALEAAGLDAATADPPGGRLLRGEDGAPTGVALEHAAQLVDPAVPLPDEAGVAGAIGAYAGELHALGVVGCHDPGEVSPEPALERGLRLYGRLAAAGRLPLRVHASVRQEQLGRALDLGLRSGDRAAPPAAADPIARRYADRARVGWLKLFADGSLGSRTAALLAPYLDTGGRGELLLPPAELLALIERGARAGLAPQVHAIGDRAARLVLETLAAVPAARALPLAARMEHAQLVAAADVPRFAALGVAASVQPFHLVGDGPAARAAWGDRLADAYRWRSLASTGVPLAFGSDAPVEAADPWAAIAISVTRRVAPGEPPVAGDEALELARALRAACLDPVIVAGEAGRAGRLMPGHRADLVVVPAAALEEPVRAGGALAGARSRLTLIDGQVVYRAADLDA